MPVDEIHIQMIYDITEFEELEYIEKYQMQGVIHKQINHYLFS